LAVLGAPDFFQAYRLRRSVPDRAVVADTFHVKPLMRIVQSADAFHVLALNRQEMRLFEGNRDTLDEIDLIPGARTITEALGDQRTEPHLTVASYGSAAGGLAQRHGHGSRKDEVDVDTERFFRAVDRSILEHYSQPSGLPLILTALTEHHAVFRRVSQNPCLVDPGVQLDPRVLNLDTLRQRAWQVAERQYIARLERLVELFGHGEANERGSRDLAAIAGAAAAGRVGTLLIDADRVVPGRLVANGDRIEFGDLAHPFVDDILDDLGELVLKMRGDVVVVPSGRMPTDTGAAAIYRF
jgi:Bacterial archaeo-eukaryotic release factor family 3